MRGVRVRVRGVRVRVRVRGVRGVRVRVRLVRVRVRVCVCACACATGCCAPQQSQRHIGTRGATVYNCSGLIVHRFRTARSNS